MFSATAKNGSTSNLSGENAFPGQIIKGTILKAHAIYLQTKYYRQRLSLQWRDVYTFVGFKLKIKSCARIKYMSRDHPIPKDQIKFDTKDKTAKFIRQWMQKKHFKKCAHLGIKENPLTLHHLYSCEPKCSHACFDIEKRRDSHFFKGCPEDCSFYQPKWRGKIITSWNIFISVCNKFKKNTIRLLWALHSLDWKIQIIIVLAILFGYYRPFFEKIVPIIISLKCP